MSIQFCSRRGNFDVKLTHPKIQDRRKFGKALLSFKQHEEDSEKDLKLFKKVLREYKSLDMNEKKVSFPCKISKDLYKESSTKTFQHCGI